MPNQISAEDLQPFATLLEAGQLAGLIRSHVDCEVNRENAKVSVKLGSKYARVDVGNSGRYMVNRATDEIFGVKAYGVVHPGYRFGTLATIHEYDWSHYRAVRLPHVPSPVTAAVVVRKAFVCRHCEGVYADEPVSQCDCMAGTGHDFWIGEILYVKSP